MSGAYVGRSSKLSQREVAPSGLMVALRLVDGKLAFLVLLAPHIFFDIWLGEKMHEIRSLSTFAVKRAMAALSILL